MKNILLILFLVLLPFFTSFPQQNEEELKQLIITKDSTFWVAYNNCDVDGMTQFLSDDLEFYHDKNGFKKGSENITEIITKYLCGNDNFRIRREAVEGTVEVFSLTNHGVIYGAIISGEHLFYEIEKGKEETLEGRAKFTQVWILKEGSWKMNRILSYDHIPADNSD